MAKSPVAGKVKTRLCPPCTPAEAAAVAEAALADTLDAVRQCGADRRIVALDGEPGPWLPPGFEVIQQRGDGLAARLTNAWSATGGGGIQIGMDTPQIGPTRLDELLAMLDTPAARSRSRPPAVLGPARDGGWWTIGWMNADPAAVFADIPTSTGHTGDLQLNRLRRLGFDVAVAPVERDIDTFGDLAEVVRQAPSGRTAAVARRLQYVQGAA